MTRQNIRRPLKENATREQVRRLNDAETQRRSDPHWPRRMPDARSMIFRLRAARGSDRLEHAPAAGMRNPGGLGAGGRQHLATGPREVVIETS
jgi:hypothetical protein